MSSRRFHPLFSSSRGRYETGVTTTSEVGADRRVVRPARLEVATRQRAGTSRLQREPGDFVSPPGVVSATPSDSSSESFRPPPSATPGGPRSGATFISASREARRYLSVVDACRCPRSRWMTPACVQDPRLAADSVPARALPRAGPAQVGPGANSPGDPAWSPPRSPRSDLRSDVTWLPGPGSGRIRPRGGMSRHVRGLSGGHGSSPGRPGARVGEIEYMCQSANASIAAPRTWK